MSSNELQFSNPPVAPLKLAALEGAAEMAAAVNKNLVTSRQIGRAHV